MVKGCGARNILELLERRFRFFHGIKRQRRFVARVTFLGGELRVFFLQVRGIGKQQAAKFARGGICVDRAVIAGAHQPRKIAGVVDMRVGENNPIDGGRIDRTACPNCAA